MKRRLHIILDRVHHNLAKNGRERSWIQATIVKATGPLSYTIQTPVGQILRSHTNKVIRPTPMAEKAKFVSSSPVGTSPAQRTMPEDLLIQSQPLRDTQLKVILRHQ